MENNRDFTVLSFGAGQESTVLLYLLARDASFRRRWAPGRLLVLGCDTGDEHPETYEHVKWCAQFCEVHGIEFLWLTAHPERFNAPWAVGGFQSTAWATLTTQYKRNSAIGSRQYARTCTDNLKIGPFYRGLAWYVSGRATEKGAPVIPNRALAFGAWSRNLFGKIRVIIGFAKGEERRAEKTTATLQRAGKGALPKWRRETFELVFPLIFDPLTNWDREESQRYMRLQELPVPVPSNCMRCHFRGPVELLWLARNHPGKFEEWVQMEEDKLAKYRERGLADDKNQGVYGKRTLRQELAEAEKKHGHMTLEELETYRNSHGHCVSNAF